MTIHGPSFRKLALSTFLLSLPLNSAFAQDATAVAEQLKASLAAQSVDISWTGVTGNASSMPLTNACCSSRSSAENARMAFVSAARVFSRASVVMTSIAWRADRARSQ